jgi:hypothetical protein
VAVAVGLFLGLVYGGSWFAVAVQRGEPVSGPRLAPSVLASAKAAMSAAGREQRLRWVFFVFPAVTPALAAQEIVAGSVRGAAYLGAVTVILPGFAWLRPGRLERGRKKAEEAARLAEGQLNRPSVD